MTFQQLLADVYRRTGFATSPTADVVTRIKAFVNETQQELFREPGMEFLQNDSVTFASVIGQPTYGLPYSATRVKTLYETTNRTVLWPMSLGEYRERYPDPSTTTGTPTRYVDLGLDAVLVEPSDASSIFVVGAAGDVGTAYIEGTRDTGVPFSDSVAMTGVTAVAFPTFSDILSITKFYLSTAAVGTVVLHEDSGSGTTLSIIPIGQTYARYRRIALAVTPSAAITYTADIERAATDLINNNDEPLLPPQFHHILAIGARVKEYEKTQDQRYGIAKQEFDKAVRKLKFWFYDSSVGTPNMRGIGVTRPSILEGSGSVPSSSSSSTPLAATAGGTGFASYTVGDLLYADTASTLAKRNAVAAGKPLMSQGVGVAPTFDTNPTFSGNVTVSGTAHVVGAVTLDGNVTLGDAGGDATTVSGTLGVTGATTLSSTLHAVGAVTMDGAVTLGDAVGDATVVSGTLTATAALATFATGKLIAPWTVITSTSTGAQNNWAPATIVGNTLIEWNGASDAAITGIDGGTAGQLITIKNITTSKIITFASLSGSSDADNQFTNMATSAVTPVAWTGYVTYQHDGTNWKIVAHDQGAWITPTFDAAHFTGNNSMTWTLTSGDVSQMQYKLSGKSLKVLYFLSATTVAGTPSTNLQISNGQWGGFTAAVTTSAPALALDNGATPATVSVSSVVASTTIILSQLDIGASNWAAATNATQVRAQIEFEVT